MSAMLSKTARFIAFAAVIFGSSPSPAAAEQDEDAAAAPTKIDIRIQNRSVIGDKVIRLTQDQLVELVWTTDVAAELHIHGYDIRFEISPEAPAEVSFRAHATGRFAVTSHGFGGERDHGHETLVYIEVYPK